MTRESRTMRTGAVEKIPRPSRKWNLLAAAILGSVFLFAPLEAYACPLVIGVGSKQRLQVVTGGYCRINGTRNAAAPISGPDVRRRAFISNSDGNSIAIIDRDTYQMIKTLPVGRYPHHMIVSLDGHYLYVGNAHSNTASVIDLATETIVKTLPLLDPYNLYYTPDGKFLVTTLTGHGRVDIRASDQWNDMQGATGWPLVAKVPTGKDPNHFAFSPDGRFMYVTNEYSHQLSVLDLQARKVTRQVETGRRPVDVSIAPGGKVLFVAIYGEGEVKAYDTESFAELERIPTGAGAHGMAMSVDGRTLFVSNRNANSVSVIDVATRKVTKTFEVPKGPDMMEVTPNGKELWVTGRYGSEVFVIDLSTGEITHRIKTGAAPHGVALIDLAIPKTHASNQILSSAR